MKREYQKRKSEQLHEWVRRLAEDVLWGRLEPEERREMLSELSKQSYFEGVHASEEIGRKYH